MSDKFGKKYGLFSLLGTGQNLLGHGTEAKGHGADTFFIIIIALKRGAEPFFAVSSHGSDTFFHYLEANEKIFTEKKMPLQLYFSLK